MTQRRRNTSFAWNLLSTHSISQALPVPQPPPEFGQDGGALFRLYDNLAAEIDEDMVKSMKEHLDGLLIFAGLFAGVNSAFLVLTLPLLSPNPIDDTNALLSQNNAFLVQMVEGLNGAGMAKSTLPSSSFRSSPAINTVNALFATSLVVALCASLFAVLGRQWLISYRKRSGGTAGRQRWEQLNRFLGAQRWHLEFILDDMLPSLLQFGLVIFFISFVSYLHILNPFISYLIVIPISVALTMFVLSALLTVWDEFCPFHSPLSRLFCYIHDHMSMWIGISMLKILLIICSSLARFGRYVAKLPNPRQTPALPFAGSIGVPIPITPQDPRNAVSAFADLIQTFSESAERLLVAPKVLGAPEDNDHALLQAVIVKRTFCISDDQFTTLCAISNVFTVTETRALELLWMDEAFYSRLIRLNIQPYQRAIQHWDHRPSAAEAAVRLYRGAIAHIFLSIGSTCSQLSRSDNDSRSQELYDAYLGETLDESGWLTPITDDSEPPHSTLIQATFAAWLLRASMEQPNPILAGITGYIERYSSCLSASNWRLTSLIICSLCHFPRLSLQPELEIPRTSAFARPPGQTISVTQESTASGNLTESSLSLYVSSDGAIMML